MTQTKLEVSRIRGRLIPCAGSSALGLSALFGAAVLSGGQVNAATGWTPNPVSPTFPATGPASTSIDFTSIPLVNNESPWLADKRVTYIDSNLPNATTPYNWEFAFDPSFARPWRTDLDFPGAGTTTPGYFVYKIEISSASPDIARCGSNFIGKGCGTFFHEVELFGTSGTNNLTKEVGTGYAGGAITGQIGSTLTTNNPILNINGDYSTLYVKQSWSPSGGAVLDQTGDGYNQKVPGPLPILSAGAAFGFSRKLRSYTKLLRKSA